MYIQPSRLDDLAFLIMFAACLVLIAIIVLMGRQNRRIGAYADRLEGHISTLQGATEQARQAFARYVVIHQEKGAGGEEKARANQQLADDMAEALRRTGFRPNGVLEQVFADMRERMERVGQAAR